MVGDRRAITAQEPFTAGEHAGQFTVRVKADGIEAIAEVRVAKKGDAPTPPPSGEKLIRWSGDVPPQKWMNFYMKVLSRFASSPELKLTVSFQVPAEDDQAAAKVDEARSGLRELGLNDDVVAT